MAGQPTTREILDELEREIRMRHSVYPRWVAAGKLDKATADRRIELLRAARDRLLRRWRGLRR